MTAPAIKAMPDFDYDTDFTAQARWAIRIAWAEKPLPSMRENEDSLERMVPFFAELLEKCFNDAERCGARNAMYD